MTTGSIGIGGHCLSGRQKGNERSGQVEKESPEVAGASEKDKEMPPYMVVPHLLADVEQDSCCVEQASCQYPPEEPDRSHREYWFCGNDGKPSHTQIDCQRYPFIPAEEEQLVDYTTGGETPYKAEEAPTPRSAQAD